MPWTVFTGESRIRLGVATPKTYQHSHTGVASKYDQPYTTDTSFNIAVLCDSIHNASSWYRSKPDKSQSIASLLGSRSDLVATAS